MMANTVKLQCGECCCCLQKGDHRELTEEYYLNGQPEIYEVLFKDTFDIVLKYPENTKLICDCCIVELRQANHFRTMVESSQQSLSKCINWQPVFDNVVEYPLEQLTRKNIKCEPNNQMEEAKNYLEQSECTMEGLNNNVEETNLKEETLVVEKSSQLNVSIFIKRDSDDDMEGVPIADHSNREYPLEQLTSKNIKCEPNNQMEEAKKYVEQSERTMEGLNNNVEETNVKEENSVVEESSQLNVSITIKRESVDDMEGVPIADHSNTQNNSDSSTSSFDKLAITQHNMKILKVLLTRNPVVEQLLSYDSNCHHPKKGHLEKRLLAHIQKKVFYCDVCQYKATRKQYLNLHMRTHTGEKPFSCAICQYKTANKRNLTMHTRSHTGDKQYSCDFCQYKAAYKGHLSVHMRIHTGIKPFCCNVCQYKATQKADITKHMRIHTGEKPFSCGICQFKTAYKSNLTMHMRVHTGEKPFSCDFCQYKSANKVHLSVHMRIHNREKPFSCGICLYKSADKRNLSMHMRIHTGKKPFSCGICQYKAAHKGHLSAHMRTHTGEKPFSCDVCQYKATQKGEITRHMRTHTGEKPFSCDMCQYKAARKENLSVHMRNHTTQILQYTKYIVIK